MADPDCIQVVLKDNVQHALAVDHLKPPQENLVVVPENMQMFLKRKVYIVSPVPLLSTSKITWRQDTECLMVIPLLLCKMN